MGKTILPLRTGGGVLGVGAALLVEAVAAGEALSPVDTNNGIRDGLFFLARTRNGIDEKALTVAEATSWTKSMDSVRLVMVEDSKERRSAGKKRKCMT
jgi:hypothetical protein